MSRLLGAHGPPLAVLTLLPSPGHRAQAFVRDWRERWGSAEAAEGSGSGAAAAGSAPAGPDWLECGWQEATNRAVSEGKFLLVYLHAWQHQASAPAFTLRFGGGVRSDFALSQSKGRPACTSCLGLPALVAGGAQGWCARDGVRRGGRALAGNVGA